MITTRQGMKQRCWWKDLASFPLGALCSQPPAVATTVPPSTGLRSSRAKGMILCPSTRIHVPALKIQIPCPFVISNKSSSLRTQHSKKNYFFFVFDGGTFPEWQYGPEQSWQCWRENKSQHYASREDISPLFPQGCVPIISSRLIVSCLKKKK